MAFYLGIVGLNRDFGRTPECMISVNYIDRNDNYIDRRSGVNNQHHPVSPF
jgi:hypothetical protein